MLEDDFSGELLDRYGFSGPHALWEGMYADGVLSTTVINNIFSEYTSRVSDNIGIQHSLRSVLEDYQFGVLSFRCRMVDTIYTETDELPLPSIDIVGENGRLVPVFNINFQEFNSLLNGTPELVATLIQFLYINHRLHTGQATAFQGHNGDIDFDDVTTWGMNDAVATTLISMNVDMSRYSANATNELSPEQKDYYRTLLDDARAVWDVPYNGPFVLN